MLQTFKRQIAKNKNLQILYIERSKTTEYFFFLRENIENRFLRRLLVGDKRRTVGVKVRGQLVSSAVNQGCQIFLGTTYQNGGKYTKLPQRIPNGHTIHQLAVK
jgi:hypothetical protein